jgi:hypothetical protein
VRGRSFAALLALVGCDSGAASYQIDEAQLTGVNVWTSITVRDAGDPISVVPEIGKATLALAKRIQSGDLKPTRETEYLAISVAVESPTGRNDLGNLRYPIAAIQQLKLADATPVSIINAIDRIEPGTGSAFDLATRYCTEADTSAESFEFCVKVREAQR